MNSVVAHEVGHTICFWHYGIKSKAEFFADGTAQVTPEPHYLNAEAQLVVDVAGAVAENMYNPSNNSLHSGLGEDSKNICKLLGSPEKQSIGYSISIALLILGDNRYKYLVPPEHIAMLKDAIKTATEILTSNDKFMKEIYHQGAAQ
jgi:hypothetical protein